MTEKEIKDQEQSANLEQKLEQSKGQEVVHEEVKVQPQVQPQAQEQVQKRAQKPIQESRRKPAAVVEVGNLEGAYRNETAEVKEVLVSVNRTTKVVKGGRRFSFAAVVIVGDGQGRVGYGLGKAKEILDAKSKATQAAKKNMIKVQLKENRTIFHDVKGSFGSGQVVLRSARGGTGVIAGGPMRSVFEMLGVHDIVAKSLGSSNVHNIIGATFDALRNLCSPEYINRKRAIE